MASLPRVFPCNTCSITFQTSELQRSHMRQSWHISNLRRRVAGQPALSEEQFATQSKSQEPILRKTNDSSPKPAPSSTSDESDSIRQPPLSENLTPSSPIPPTQCLFCPVISPTLTANLTHMSSLHGLFIPCPSSLHSLDSFLGYLSTIVFTYHECLYCGVEKSSVDGVQTHMRDKGHCMIDLSGESELLDFWDFSDSEDGEEGDAMVKLSETEMRLPSGTVINSRGDRGQFRARPGLAQARTRSSQYRSKREETRALTPREDQEKADEGRGTPSRSNDRRVAVRGEMGLVGVPESQRRALQITEKKMQRREAVARAAQRYAAEQAPVLAKYYKTENPVYQAG